MRGFVCGRMHDCVLVAHLVLHALSRRTDQVQGGGCARIRGLCGRRVHTQLCGTGSGGATAPAVVVVARGGGGGVGVAAYAWGGRTQRLG